VAQNATDNLPAGVNGASARVNVRCADVRDGVNSLMSQVPYSGTGNPIGRGYPSAEPNSGVDTRWVTATVLLLILIGSGAVYASIVGPAQGTTFASRAVMGYAPMAALLIFWLGWAPQTFPIAAGMFYGFLGTCQAASNEFFLMGDDKGAITVEMVLALPLILTGLLGPSGRRAGQPTAPTLLSSAFIVIVGGAILSTVLAASPYVALYTLLGRFLVPIGVTLATYRRLRNLDDYKLIWYTFLLGMLMIGAFQYERIIGGVLPWNISSTNQRFLSLSMSQTFPLVFCVGPALWFGHALAVRKSLFVGLAMFFAVGFVCMMAWLGAHRAPVFVLGLLVLWWIPGHILRYSFSARSFVYVLIGGVAVAYITLKSFGETFADVNLASERFGHLLSGGLSNTARWPLWMFGLQKFAESPIWGAGLNNWVVFNHDFASVHSTPIGILMDMGLIGAAGFSALFGASLWCVRKRNLLHFRPIDREFILGARAGFVCLMIGLVSLPFTSGQPLNNIFAYTVYLFPMLAMLVHTRHPPPTLFNVPAQSGLPQLGPPFAPGYLPRP
jgi:hypothetical protein